MFEKKVNFVQGIDLIFKKEIGGDEFRGENGRGDFNLSYSSNKLEIFDIRCQLIERRLKN